MALFNIPKRKEVSITDIVKQAQEERTEKPKIKLKSGTLLGKLEAIKETVKKNLGDVADDYLLITTDEDFIDYCKKASMCEYVALDTETMGLEFDEQCSIVGISLMAKGMQAMYAPIGHLSTLTEELAPKQISKSALKRGIELLYESNVDIIFHNAYYDLVVIYANTNIWLRIAWDTMPCAFLLNENESHSLKYLYDKYVMNGDAGVHKFAELFDGINFCYVPYNYAYIYAAHDAEMTLKLYEFQKPFMTKGTDECKEYKLEKISDIFFNEELPLIPILAEMKYRGIEIDMDRAKELHDKYTRLWEDAKQKYYDAVSYYKDDILAYNKIHSDKPIEYPVNYDSPLQLQILFYDIIKTGVIFKKEPRGTGKHVLEEVLANPKYRNTPFYKIVETLSNVKKYYKVLSTFVDELPKTAKRLGGRLHSNFNSCSAHCVIGNTLVLTDKGYEKIGDVVKNDFGEEERSCKNIVVNRYGNYESSTHTYRYDNVDTIKVRTYFGFEIEGTPHHPVMISKNTFKCLKDITEKDRIYIPLGYNKFPNEYIKFDKDTGKHRIFGKSVGVKKLIPEVFNEDLAEFLGMYHADGYTNTSNDSYSIRIENHDKKVINRIKYLSEKLFGITPYMNTTYNKIKKNNRSCSCITSIALCCIDKYIGHGARNKKIPKEIYKSPKSVILSYIKGLTLDSSYYEKNGGVELCISVYDDEDALFIQSVLCNLGIVSSIRHNSHVSSGYSGNRIAISNNNCIKFINLIGVEYNYNVDRSKDYSNHSSYATLHDNYMTVRVKSIEYGNNTVYDFHVPITHSFISNSIVSHNTGRMSSNNCNYQQLPSKLGDIRNMFVAGKNRVMIGADFKKQEVCVAAAISKDEKLLEALSSGLDVYSKIASIAFNNKYEDNLEFYPDGTTNKEGKARRSASKAVTLGCLYSKGVQSISEDLKISKERAQEVYDAVMKAFPTLAQWIKDTEAFGLKHHYVDGLYGRRRRLPDLALPKYEFKFNASLDKRLDDASKNYYKSIYMQKLNRASFDEKESIINEAEYSGITIIDNSTRINKSLRRCVNSVVQGSSADITKKALVMIGNDPIMKKLDAKLELTIHDEQIVSCPKENAFEVAKRLEYLTTHAAGDLPITLAVDMAISDCWYGDEYDFDENHSLVKRSSK